MLEESKMDKKSINRSSQPLSRATAVDCKKNSDLIQRPQTRYSKKREGPGNAPKNEPNRKNVPAQRGRGQIDRRPRTRGSSGFVLGGVESTGLAEDEPELGSVFVPGSKKQNLNHLLNFMYTPRGVTERRGPTPRRSVPQRSTHPHNHELYLQACCQFVVKEDGVYNVNLLDPDVPVKWEQIEEILVRSTGKSECPICLGTPAAGRVGRCGHVHCWPCALHYAAAHERQPPPCPVCAAPFRVEQMKPARILQWESPSDEVTMRLVRRLRGSTIVEVAPPRGELTEMAEAKVLPLVDITSAPYSKLFAANKQQVLDILARERKELHDQMLAEIDTTEIVYMEQALAMLKQKEESINLQADPIIHANANEKDSAPTVYEIQSTSDNRIDWFDEDEGAACMENIHEKMGNLTVTESNLNPDATEFELVNDNEAVEFPLIENDTPIVDDPVSDFNPLTDIDKENQAKYFYFYQAEDGQQVFLNSLNVRLLNASWGALSAAPPIIRGHVLHRETQSLVEQTRKHMPYAAHLPLHCPFDIVELDLQPPFVTNAALNSYAEELERRARARARYERDERRRERAYRRTMEGPPKPDFSSPVLFPPTSQFSSPPLDPSPSPGDTASPEVAPSSSSGLSFAKMASSSGTWRVRPTKPVRPSTPPVDEGGAPRTLSLSDAIEAALHAAPTKKKTKKNKQKLLFATGLQRAE